VEDGCLPDDLYYIHPDILAILNDPDLKGVFDEKELLILIIEEELPTFSITDVSFSRSHLLTITVNHR